MRLKGFGIKNFRSFNEEGVFLSNISKINIIIGKNNSGKSNVLRFIQLLNSNLSKLTNFPNDIKNQFRRNENSTSIVIEKKGSDLPIIKTQFFNKRGDEFDFEGFLENKIQLDYILQTKKIKVPKDILELDQNELIKFQSYHKGASKQLLIEEIERSWGRKVEEVIKEYFKHVIYIPHLRVIKEGHNLGDSNSSINGSNIISKMFEMQNPSIGEEHLKDKFDQIQNFVGDLINKTNLKLEIPHTKEEIVLTIDGNRLPLDSFGTGIHQLVILCSTLVINDNCIVCIEEPEIHLHPELQRKFINFLHETKNTYFITTHSNVFLDNKKQTSIYHVTNNGVCSDITYTIQDTQTSSILSDLGYTSSDILQANCIVWVEGPSDRIYLLKWLSLLDSELIEGLHFSIMFYGGRLLSNLSFDSAQIDENLIPLLKLNRNAYVIMDRDGFNSQFKLNKTKSRIIKEIGERNCWVTKGREIENYLSSNTLGNWLNTENIKLNPDKKLEDLIPIKVDIKYNKNKTRYSKEIVQHIELIDLDIMDLQQKINFLVKRIRTWNFID